LLVRGLLAAVLTAVAPVAPAVSAGQADVVVRPTDTGYAGQWGIVQTRVNQAWSAARGNPRVTIAIVDTGVSRLPDFGDRLLPGHDFVNNDDDASDDNGHGTMAAGVAAAGGNNRLGVAGVCWTCRILPVKVLDAKGAGGYDNFAKGIRYAADRGATIISASFGGNDDAAMLREAVDYATGKGSLVIAAAGNKGSTQPHYPAAIPAALAVGGVDSAGVRYSWSNYGPSWVDLTAPGCNPAQQRDGAIGQYCGTSSATPFVAGVAGLLASIPSAPPASLIRAALTHGATNGRVDAVGALTALGVDLTPPAVTVYRNSKYVTARATDASGVARLELLINGKVTTTFAGYLRQFPVPAAVRTVAIRAIDRKGNARVVAAPR
jgi:subtilisin family serine protease